LRGKYFKKFPISSILLFLAAGKEDEVFQKKWWDGQVEGHKNFRKKFG